MKMIWNILTMDTVFTNFKRDIYIVSNNIWDLPLISTSTKNWRDLWVCLKEIVDLSAWEIGEGYISFLYENYTGQGVLST